MGGNNNLQARKSYSGYLSLFSAGIRTLEVSCSSYNECKGCPMWL